ncbi:ROK family transcriptional regulator [Cryptosporangium minutisporangium]|uniref:ROK family transcriptional regulator n=1 Tax=Cryptosporangium minutisporangium TaxID=113569 RepID=A0ABP6SYT6_9ACTN
MTPRPRPDNSAQSQILLTLRDEGPVSRAELGDRLELPRARLAAELSRLTELGLARDGGPAASRGGRRSTMVELDPELRFVGVDLGVTSVTLEVTDASLEPVASVEEEIDIRRGPEAVLDRIDDLVAKLRADGHLTRLAGIGLGVPGPVSFRDGVPVSPPIMPGWDRYPVREELAGRHGCPVVVDNDVNIMVVGERRGGVARSVDDLLFVKVGTGIGCGIVVRGQVYRGVDGCAGDIGHIQVDPHGPVCACGNAGCLEAVFGGAALARDALAAARNDTSPSLAERLRTHGTVTAADVGAGAVEGDPVCIGLIRDGGRRLGGVLASLVSFFNPSMIVIGGGLAGLGHLLLAEVRSVIYRRSLPLATRNLPVVLSELGSRAGVAGATALVSELAYGPVTR